MKRINVTEYLFTAGSPMALSKLPKDLLPTDFIVSSKDEEGNDEISIVRERLENDKEFEERMDMIKEFTNRRYATYLKLKKEFENA